MRVYIKTRMITLEDFRRKFNAQGTAEIFDDWNFDWNLVNNIKAFFTGAISRNFMGQMRTMVRLGCNGHTVFATGKGLDSTFWVNRLGREADKEGGSPYEGWYQNE